MRGCVDGRSPGSSPAGNGKAASGDLEPGCMTVSFQDPQQALERLLALALAISNDFARFERVTRRGETQ